MRFLSIAKPTPAMGAIPPDALLQMFEASFEKIQQQREERKILEMYWSPAGYTIVIIDYDNPEEWAKDRLSIPVLNYMETQLYPLADGMTSMKAMIESIKAMVK